MALDREQVLRYSRQILLPEVGARGQEALLGARVLLFGGGAAGRTAADYLRAAGVGDVVVAPGAMPLPGEREAAGAERPSVVCAAGGGAELRARAERAAQELAAPFAVAPGSDAPALAIAGVLEGALAAAEAVRVLLGLSASSADGGVPA